jgi:hypothetical protein
VPTLADCQSRITYDNSRVAVAKIIGRATASWEDFWPAHREDGSKGLRKAMAELLEKQPELEVLVAALLKVHDTIVEQIAMLDAGLQRIPKAAPPYAA